MAKQFIPLVFCRTADEVAAWTANRVLGCAEQAIAQRGAFSLVLAGGRTPLAAYRLLAEQEARWDCWHVYFGDERCLPLADAQRNSVGAAEALLDRVAIPAANRHPIPAELGPEQAASRYADLIAGAMPFDLVLLGMGEDGHTASLFPGHPLAQDALVNAVHGAPKPPPERVSLSPRALAACREMLILITGHSKREAVAAWCAGEAVPAARVASLAQSLVLVDSDAVGGLGNLDSLPIVGGPVETKS